MPTEVKENKQTKKESKFMDEYSRARRTGVPLLAIETTDPAAVMKQITAKNADYPVVSWDKSDGFSARNDMGKLMLKAILGASDKDEANSAELNRWSSINDPESALRMASRFPGEKDQLQSKLKAGTILFMLNGHLFLNSNEYANAIEVRQSLWNLRDQYKKNLRMVIILCPSIQLPEELKQDVIILDHPLPTSEELVELEKRVYKSVNLQEPEEKVLVNIAQEVKGLSQFEVEQVLAMSITEHGMDMDKLWEKKKKSVEQTPGLRIYRGPENFSYLQGVSSLREHLSMIMESDDAPTFIVFMDELEKQLSGTKGADTTMQEMHGQMLSWMADEEILALLVTGQPGCSKTHSAKCVAGEYQRLLALLNLSEVKSKWVGESTGQMKAILKKLTSIGKPLLIATSNNIDVLSPELRDRFNMGTFFADFPDKAGRVPLWKQYKDKYKIKSFVTWDDDSWSPRNIRDCCSLAARKKCTLEQAKDFIITIKQSDSESIEKRRNAARGKLLSTDYPGVYKGVVKPAEEERTINLTGVGEA